MSLIIKGMDMPKSCVKYVGDLIECECIYFMDDDWSCRLQANSKPFPDEDGFKEQYKGCPLIEIPTPHGRLIDASELIKSYMKGTKTDIDDFYDTIDIIDNAPTILEAEE